MAMFFGTAVQELLVGPRPKPDRGSPVVLGLLVFVVVLVLAHGFVPQSLSGGSIQVRFAFSFPIALAGGLAAYEFAKRSRSLRHEREVQEEYEMQRNRAAEAEKQIAEMKHKAAKAEGTK